MEKFDELLKSLDLEFFGNGRHKVPVAKALELSRQGKAVMVDVRTPEEVRNVRFDFALNIPVTEMPERAAEIPKQMTVIVFCSSIVRAAIVYAYLRTKGHEDVKILTAGLSEIAGCMKPGYVLETMREVS